MTCPFLFFLLREKYTSFYEEVIGMLEKESNKQPYYNENDAVNFIASETGINKRVIRMVLNSEMRYMASVGIVDWDGLEEYLNELESDPEFNN